MLLKKSVMRFPRRENNLYAATELGLGILLRKYEQFRQNWMRPVSWETGNMISIPTITVLRCCNVTSPAIHRLTERDARIYSHYLQTEHKRFVKLAEELAAGR